MEIRLGIIEVKSDEQKITFLDTISEEDFLILNQEILNLEKYNSNEELHLIFIINFIELTRYFQEAVNELASKQIYMLDDNREQFQFIFRNANRLFLNLLSSGRTLLDHSETYLKRKYGNSSQEIVTFKEVVKKIFDDSFEYRFIYKLRNYAQHCGMPISTLRYHNENVIKGEKLSRKVNLNPIFKREELLTNYREWGSIVKLDIEKQSEEFSVMPIVCEYYKCIEKVSATLKIIDVESLKKSIKEIHKKTQFKNYSADKQLCIFYNFIYPNINSFENSTFSTITIPTQLIKKIEGSFFD